MDNACIDNRTVFSDADEEYVVLADTMRYYILYEWDEKYLKKD